jgi:hypothetical protein
MVDNRWALTTLQNFIQYTVFRKLNLLPSSCKKIEISTLFGPLRLALSTGTSIVAVSLLP